MIANSHLMDMNTEAERRCVRGVAGGIAALLAAVVITGCGVQTKTPDQTLESSENRVIKTASGPEMVSIPGGEFTMGADRKSVV